MTVVPIDVDAFLNRLQRIRHAWSDKSTQISKCAAVVVNLGQPSDTTVYQKSTAMFAWLLGFEFPETSLILSENKAVVITSPKKGAILESICQVEPSLVILKRGKELGQSDSLFEEAFNIIKKGMQGTFNIGGFLKDVAEGPIIGEWKGFLDRQTSDFEWIDVASDIGALLACKDKTEIENTEISAKLTSHLMADKAIKKILQTVDEDRGQITHAQIAEDIDSFVVNHISRLRSHFDPNQHVAFEFVDICYPPIIQSNGVYSLKPSAESTDEPLHTGAGPILCSVGLRYKAYCSNMSRTLLIDPTKEQEEQMVFIQSLQNHLLGIMKSGMEISKIYHEGVRFCTENKPKLVAHLPNNFGFGIGIEFRAPEFVVNAKNTQKLETGMTFNLMVGLHDVISSTPNTNPYSLMLSDTVLITDTCARVLTNGFEKLRDISFSFKRSPKVESTAVAGPRTRSRRQGSVVQKKDENSEKKRKEHQKELGQLRIEEALQKYGDVNDVTTTSKAAEALRFESYRKDVNLPKELGQNGIIKIHVDKRAETVILPIFGLAVPFHINTIKNITKNDEGDISFIRINFNSPGRGVGKKDTSLVFENPMAHFLRGISIRIADQYRAQEVMKEIQDLRKHVADRENARKERADLVEQGQLIEITGKRPVRLSDIYIRPAMDGKRLPGDVEIHSNGIRYRSQIKGDQKVEVLFANVKHFFFQPCDHEAIVLVHFHLHHPIMIGKKKTKDIQFYREALESMVDETSGRRTKMRFGDEDEIAQEREEKQRRTEANNEFRSFAEKVVEASRGTLEVDVPFRELGFSGVPSRQNVLLQPTTDCLVHLVEPPYLIVTLSEVEVVFLERVVFGLKNFDLVFVYKDHSIPPVHINTIPMTQLEAVKDWLDSVDVYFVESKVNFNWNNIMKTVNEDPVGFYEMGGWTYLQPDEAADDSEEEGSSEYDPDDEEDEVAEEEEDDDDDAFSEEESEEEENSEEEDDYSDEDEEESEGPEWDDLEEEARLHDERSNSKKRPPAPSRASNRPPAKRR